MKKPKFDWLEIKVKNEPMNDGIDAFVKKLNRVLKKGQRVLAIKLVASFRNHARWTVIIENVPTERKETR
jgi:hypothetical protein